MELNRLLRVVRQRWIFVLALGVIGAAAGWGLTVLSNQDIDPRFQATAPVRLVPEAGETIADLADDLETELEVATLATADLSTSQPGSSIQIDPATARLLFVAEGESEEQARERAGNLRQAYFEVDPSMGGGAVDELLADLENQAAEIESLLDGAQQGFTPTERDLANAHDLVDLKIDAVRQRIVALTVANAAVSVEEREANDAEMAALEVVLDQLEAEKAALPPRPSEELSVNEQLQVRSLQRRLELLGLEYERLFLQQLGITTTGRGDPIVLQNLTPLPGSAPVNAAIGLVAGMAIALLGLLLINSVRKPAWLPGDVPVAVLGDIPGRRVTSSSGSPWYDQEETGPRKAAIQALRTALEGRLLEGPATLGISGHLAGSHAVHALAADLATSFASAGRSVLLVDADFEEPSDITEYRVEGQDLASLLELDELDHLLREEVANGLDAAVYIRDRMAVLPAGRPPASPADAIAGRHFRYVIDEANRRFDLVIVVGSDITSPATQVQMQRVGSVLLALWPGRSRAPFLNALVQDLNERRIAIHGAVFLQKSGRLAPAASQPAPVPTSPPEGVSLLDRLTSRRSPPEVAPEVDQPSLTTRLVGRLEHERGSQASLDAGPDEDLGTSLLNALVVDGPGVYAATADYVVGRVEDMLTAHPGQGNVTADVLDYVESTGFMALTPAKGHPLVGAHLKSEIESELGDEVGGAISDRILEVLAAGSGVEVSSLDQWLQQEFFKRHVERTHGEPQIWHFTSPRGSVQVLAAVKRLDQERLNLLETELVRRVVDRLQRDLREAKSIGDKASSARIEEQLEDAEQFAATVRMLQGGSSQRRGTVHPIRSADQPSLIWAPVWSEGIRPNLALVQRLGLLPFPVLTRSELRSFLSTG